MVTQIKENEDIMLNTVFMCFQRKRPVSPEHSQRPEGKELLAWSFTLAIGRTNRGFKT